MKKTLCAAIAIGSTLFAEEAYPEKTYPKVQNSRDYNVFGIGEFLYWRFSSPNLIYGRSGVGVKGIAEAPVSSGATYLPDFDYDPGFRAAVGIKYGPSKAFDLIGSYTFLYSDPEGSVSGNPISATFMPNNFFNSGTTATNVYTFASLSMKLHLDIAEVQSGYSFLVSRHFALRPYIAVTAYIIDADLRARYEFTTPAMATYPSAFEISKTHCKCDSWSVGPKSGLDVIFRMSDSWSFFYNINITQQITHITMEASETEEVPSAGVNFAIQKGYLSENRNITLFGLEIGPAWDEWFCNSKYHIYFRASYQACNLNSGANLSFLNNNDLDLGMQSDYRGLNVRAMFEF